MAIDLDEPSENVLQGHSAILNLYLRWDEWSCWAGMTRLPGMHIATFDTEREARLQAEAAQTQAEARVRELEEEIRRLRP